MDYSTERAAPPLLFLLRFIELEGGVCNKEEGYLGSSQEGGGNFSEELHKPLYVFIWAFHFFFLKYILLIMLLQFSHFLSPLYSPLLCTLPPTSTPLHTLSSCPWVVHIRSLAFPFPILLLTSPVYFVPTTYASYSLYLLPLSPPPPPC